MKNIEVTNATLRGEVNKMAEAKARFSAISGVDLGNNKIEVIYHFIKDYEPINLRMTLDFDEEIEHIHDIYPSAEMAENELCEMFGVKVKGVVGRLELTEEDDVKTPLRRSE